MRRDQWITRGIYLTPKKKKNRENMDDALSSIELFAIFFYQYRYELHFV